VQAVDIHETVASPAVVQDIFKKSIPLFTPQAVLEHARKLFTGKVIRSLYVTPERVGEFGGCAPRCWPGVPDERARRAQTDQLCRSARHRRPCAARYSPDRMLDVQELTFANGVKVQLWPTKDDPGRVTVKVRFGAGWRRSAGGCLCLAGQLALVSAGEGPLGRKSWTAFPPGASWASISASMTVLPVLRRNPRRGSGRPALSVCRQFAMPRWDAAPLLRARAAGASSSPASPQA
jgi:zinc protease